MTFLPASRHALPAPVGRRFAGPRRAALATALAFAVTSLGTLATAAPAFAWSGGAFSSSSEQQLVALTNQSRAAAGLGALRVDSRLTAIARSRSKDMIVRGYFSHNIPPSGKLVFSIMDAKGYCYAVAGENIGWNTYPDGSATKTVHNQFMGSAGHRKNILGKRWDVIGIGAYKGADGKKMWTVLFADRCGSAGGGAATKPKPAPKPRPVARVSPMPRPAPNPARPVGPLTASDALRPSATEPVRPGRWPGDLGLARHGDTEGGLPRRGDDVTLVRLSRAASLRVVDRPGPAGLLEAVVGDLTGLFLGA